MMGYPPPLSKSYKKAFPFKLATTSYIYPDRIVPNVMRLAPFMDGIELVLFESSGPNALPDDEELTTLIGISSLQGIDFNIHLPIDVSLGDTREEVRAQGVSTIRRMIDRTRCLNPSVYTLHLDRIGKNGQQETDLTAWLRSIIRSAEELVTEGVDPKRFSIETLEYPFEWIEEIVRRFGFSICLDIGHILTQGQNLRGYLDKYLPETSIVHLHGFWDGKDHLGIDRLAASDLKLIISRLRDYHGIVSIEVFSLEDLARSLAILEERWRDQ